MLYQAPSVKRARVSGGENQVSTAASQKASKLKSSVSSGSLNAVGKKLQTSTSGGNLRAASTRTATVKPTVTRPAKPGK